MAFELRRVEVMHIWPCLYKRGSEIGFPNLKWVFLNKGLTSIPLSTYLFFFPPIFFPVSPNLTFLSFYLYAYRSLSFFFSLPFPFSLISSILLSSYLFPSSSLLPLCSVFLSFLKNVPAWPSGATWISVLTFSFLLSLP